MRKSFFILSIFAVYLAAANTATAQNVANGLSGFTQGSDEPISIEANVLDVFDDQRKAVFNGNVEVVQGATVMKTSKLVVYYEGSAAGAGGQAAAGGGQSIRRLEASGNVVVTSEDQKATADSAAFEMASQIVTLCGNVVISQGKNVIKGEQLQVNLETKESSMVANVTCKKTAPGGRVKGILIPGSRKQ